MYEKAIERRHTLTRRAENHEEFKEKSELPGFIKAAWCGEESCEEKIKEETAFTSRCISGDELSGDEKCVCCGKKAKHIVYWAKAY